MLLHKCQFKNEDLLTLFDSKERVTVTPTRYLNYLRVNKRATESQRHIANTIKLHCQWIEENSCLRDLRVDEALEEIQNDDILDWINFQRNLNLSRNTIHNREVIIREMYDWMTTDDASARKDVPWFKNYFTQRQHRRLPRFMTAQQVIKLLLGMHNESQRVTTHFIFDTGVRISELIRLKKKDLPIEEDFAPELNYFLLRIPGSKSYDGNPYKMRDTIISRPMLARIRRYHATPEYKLARNWKMNDPEKPLFLNVKGEALSKSSIYKAIKSAWKRQGGVATEASPHRLRHGTGYSVLRSELGGELLDNLLILKGMLGHENIKTTEIYSSIPFVVLRRLAQGNEIRARYEEAEQIYELTYLPNYKNTEKRGHKNCNEEFEI